MTSSVLVATWEDGLFVVSDGLPQHEMAGHSVKALASDGRGGAIAIIDGRSLCRRGVDGVWTTIATTEENLACCVAVGDVIYAGTDDASVLRVSCSGEVEELPSFKKVAGRETWYAGSAIVNGKRVGPPLGVRSISATADGGVLLANVHVGGIPRSTDGGASWQPTIEVNSDVHEVRAHPTRPEIVAAAAAVGLCVSTDSGETWEIEQRGLHALHCSAVAFVGDDILVSATTDPFAPEGAVYRRGIDEDSPLVLVTGGLPAWLEGKVDTRCIGVNDSVVALADWKGNVYFSGDYGQTWMRRGQGIAGPSSVVIG